MNIKNPNYEAPKMPTNVVTGTPDELIEILHATVKPAVKRVQLVEFDLLKSGITSAVETVVATYGNLAEAYAAMPFDFHMSVRDINTIRKSDDHRTAYFRGLAYGLRIVDTDEKELTGTQIVQRAVRAEVYSKLPISDAWTLAIAEDVHYGRTAQDPAGHKYVVLANGEIRYLNGPRWVA